VIFGAEDRITTPADAARLVSTLKGSRLVTIPQSGHLPNLENPAAFNAALTQFCAALPA
jgi:pimeloyl-ACP methyl ester carboxylesterase